MEREARVSFRVVRVSRWSLAAVALAALVAVAVPLAQRLPFRGGAERVEPGVSLLGWDLGGLTAEEAREVVEEIGRLPLSVPEHGAGPVVLDVEATLLRVLTAPEGTAVHPAWVPAGTAATATPAAPGGEGAVQAVRAGTPGRQQVTLLFNVAWGDQHLPEILATLARHRVRTTFLVTGRWAEARQDLLRRIAQDGHEIGSHGYDDRQSPLELHRKGQLRADIDRAHRVLTGVLGRAPTFYQPHRGELDPQGEMVRLARSLGYTTVLWSRDTRDWMEGATPETVARILAGARDGDIVLLHPTPATRQALDQALQELARRQLRVVPLGELLSPGAPGTSPASDEGGDRR
ncbi:MAG: polysaccharide deacetylase family protein [Firmicutes bacterium]|nr:polysaccharide deacetylase family protein [Bacillota bacterium]